MADYKLLLEKLINNDVEFVLIGGFAAVAHGSTTLTQDIDVCIRFTPNNCSNLLKALDGTNPIYRQNKKPITYDPVELSKFKNLYLICYCFSSIRHINGLLLINLLIYKIFFKSKWIINIVYFPKTLS